MAHNNNAEHQWQLFYENQQMLASDEYTEEVYNTFAEAYNNRRLSIGDMIAISDRQAKKIQSIEDNLIGKFGFSMDAWPLIEKSSRKQRAEVFQDWIDKTGQTKKSFNQALSLIFQESRRYFELQYQRDLMEAVMRSITEGKYPARVKLFEEMTEEEQTEVTSMSPGAPLNESVPQEDIETIVKKCIEDRSSKIFIHQEGKREGKANKNQIREYIINNHPELVSGMGNNKEEEKGISIRQLSRRINKALPLDMT